MSETAKEIDYANLLQKITLWSETLGFQQLGISDIDLQIHEKHLNNWLDAGFHGEMDYMHKHGSKRSHPEQLIENTCRIISVRMDYMPPDCESSEAVLNNPNLGFVSRYALGRDYHKLMRKRLQKLATKINHKVGEFGHRVFVDSAPVLEKAIAEKAGLGWIGKHTNLINKDAGSWFFLGEIYTDLPLPLTAHPPNEREQNHCGTCTSCIESCPTKAIVNSYKVDARRCISYLTIELYGTIPVEFRKAIGNRIYGCDDCQIYCPWNKFSKPTAEKDFFTRHPLDACGLLELFNWSEDDFLKNTEGSAIRRIGYQRWLRNIAVALGNAPTTTKVISALKQKKAELNHTKQSMLIEHIDWALEQHN